VAETKVSGGGSQPGTGPEIEVIEEAPGSQPEPQGGQQAVVQSQQRAAPDEDMEDEDLEDTRAGRQPGAQQQGTEAQPGETQEQLTARQRRRRAERAARERERAELMRLRQENHQLRQGVGRIDQRLANVETSTIDGQIMSLESEIARANQVISRAVTAANGDDVVQAQEIRDVLRDRLGELKRQKAQGEQRQQQAGPDQDAGAGQVTGRPAGVTPQQQQFAGIFMSRHPWVDLRGGDADSVRVLELDTQLTQEGSDPKTPEHWMELERRVREELPQRFQSAANDNGNANGNGGGQRQQANNRQVGGRAAGGPRLPGNGSGGGNGEGGGPIKFHLSAERKQALIDMGVWDDPQERMRYIKRFVDWDKAAAQTKQ
jgi:hypothetical protein